MTAPEGVQPERERTAEQERGARQPTHYDLVLQKQQERLKRSHTGDIVMRRDEMDQQTTRQGILRNYLSSFEEPGDATTRSAIRNWEVFTHDIKRQSGKHRHQGAVMIYVTSGRGYTIVENERVDWKEGDLLLLPIVPGGVTHQHFSDEDDSEPVQWVAFIYAPIVDAIGSYMEQLTDLPGFRR